VAEAAAASLAVVLHHVEGVAVARRRLRMLNTSQITANCIRELAFAGLSWFRKDGKTIALI
jgi:hypothetical protein